MVEGNRYTVRHNETQMVEEPVQRRPLPLPTLGLQALAVTLGASVPSLLAVSPKS